VDTVLQGQAADVLHGFPAGAGYEGIVGTLGGGAVTETASRSRLKARIQLNGEPLHEFFLAFEQVAH
jgi:hypothetical protein